ncbi:peptidase M61 [Acetobacteraceae bacterium KSS12]|uniref:Peptidase M61 n=2 Tax=Rhizosaccharibacter radicis TaxID=2782605 RepID=A0ABT1VW86_9PROT|nr:peptidase M61 [Acetobacteraceae bacterium KSS12]
MSVREAVPVTGAGDMVLLYPQWLPGNHSPSGQIDKLGSLSIFANGKPIPWTRDPANMFAFHVPVPSGVDRLDVSFQFLSPVEAKEGRVVMTPAMLDLQWNSVVLYPAGYFSRDITLAPHLLLPDGWGFGSALERAGGNGARVDFKPVTLNVLVDSPLYAGRNFERVDLDPGGRTPVHLDVVADRPDQLEITPDQLKIHKALVQQAYKLFNSRHYDHYDFLLSLSDEMSGIGLEHHRSSEDGTSSGYFIDWAHQAAERDLLSHEYTHSWNGKFRRPADLWQPNFNVPEQDSLLWVYEGQTQYWGKILAARAGLHTRQEALDSLALTAATYANGVGRSWRALEDTTNDPIIAQRRPIPWRSWQRSEDYYEEGALMWLEADMTIRQLSHGQRSLDDFARTFFSPDDGSYDVLTYRFDDVVKALADVQPYDWRGFLLSHLDRTGTVPPLGGLEKGGYRLVFTDTETPFQSSVDRHRGTTDFAFSLGLSLTSDGTMQAVIWNSPAFRAGLAVGTRIVAVDGLAFAMDDLKQAVRVAKTHPAPIELLVRSGNRFRTVRIDYHDGLRYPHLSRIDNTADLLDAALSPRP